MQQKTQTTGTEIFNQNTAQQANADQAPAAEVKNEEPKPQQAPIYLGGKKFNSVEELADYTAKLEATKYQQAQPMAAPVSQASNTDKPLSELIFEDPEKALQIHEQRVIQKLKAEETARKNEQAFWTDFYNKNKDLESENDLVQFVVQKHMSELAHLHPDQAAEKIADYSRKTVVRFRGAQETTKPLPSGAARTGPASTQSAPAITENRPAPVDFVSQLKKIQKGRK
jgi:hypothetical protein